MFSLLNWYLYGRGAFTRLPALGRLIALASQRSQVLVVSHAPALIDALQSLPDCHSITLEKKLGQTTLAGEDNEYAPWQWPAR